LQAIGRGFESPQLQMRLYKKAQILLAGGSYRCNKCIAFSQLHSHSFDAPTNFCIFKKNPTEEEKYLCKHFVSHGIIL
jgi:hypothetical protein